MTQGIIITTCQQKPNIHSFKECLIVNFVISESPILPNHKNTRSILTYYLICNLCSQFSQYFFVVYKPQVGGGERLGNFLILLTSLPLPVCLSLSLPQSLSLSVNLFISIYLQKAIVTFFWLVELIFIIKRC